MSGELFDIQIQLHWLRYNDNIHAKDCLSVDIYNIVSDPATTK